MSLYKIKTLFTRKERRTHIRSYSKLSDSEWAAFINENRVSIARGAHKRPLFDVSQYPYTIENNKPTYNG